jgi:hypothetical protein
MWQWLLITPLVAASAAYAAWTLSPVPTRLRFTGWLSRRTAGGPAPLERFAARLQRAARPGDGCDSCPASRIPPQAGGKPGRR